VLGVAGSISDKSSFFKEIFASSTGFLGDVLEEEVERGEIARTGTSLTSNTVTTVTGDRLRQVTPEELQGKIANIATYLIPK
jgi:hypothetical protein